MSLTSEFYSNHRFNIFLHCFCSTSKRLFGSLSAKYPHTVDKEFLLMYDRHNYILNYMYTAA